MAKNLFTVSVSLRDVDVVKRLVTMVAEVYGDERTPGWIKERIKAFEMNSDGACVGKPVVGVIDCAS